MPDSPPAALETQSKSAETERGGKMVRRRLEIERQGFQAAEGRERQPLNRRRREAQAREAVQDGVDGDLAFQAGERRAQAEVRSVAEGDMPIIRARDVEAVGIEELRRVAIRGGQADRDALPLWERLPAEFQILFRD